MVLDLEWNASLIFPDILSPHKGGQNFLALCGFESQAPSHYRHWLTHKQIFKLYPTYFYFCFLFHFCIFESFHSNKFNNVFLNIIFLLTFIFLQGNFTLFVIDLSILGNHILISYKEIQMVPWLAFSLCYIGICKCYLYVWKPLNGYRHLSLLGFNSSNAGWINGTFFITVLPSYSICYYFHRQNLFLH